MRALTTQESPDFSHGECQGINIPAVCREVQKLVSHKLCEMLDLKKVVVNVAVDSLILEKPDPKQTVK